MSKTNFLPDSASTQLQLRLTLALFLATGPEQRFLWLVLEYFYCHTRAPSWILSSAENLASSNLQDGATKWYYFLKESPTHPTT